MIKISRKLVIIILSLILLTGCWDYEDVNNKSITISIGVDRVNNMIEFSGEKAKITASSKKEEGKAQAAEVYKVLAYGKTFEEARKHFDAESPYPIFSGATRVVVFGTRFAKQGIEPYLNRVDSLYDYRKTLLTVVSREPAKQIFDLKVEKDISVGFLIEDMLNHLSKKGEALYPNIGESLSEIASGNTCYILPYIGIEHNVIAYLGLVVMKESKLIGIIDIKDTDGILYLLSKKPILSEAIPSSKNENNIYSFRTTPKKRKIEASYEDEKVVININLDLTAELLYQYYMEKISDDEIKNMEKKISEKVRNSIASSIKKAQVEFKCDYFNFKKHFKVKYSKIFEKIDWEEKFTEAEVNVNVKTKMINMNLKDPNAKKKF